MDSFGGGESVRIFGPTAPKELCIATVADVLDS